MKAAVLAFSLTAFTGTAFAQNIDQAIKAYNDDNLTEAAFLFYDVVENADDAEARVKAEYYLAHSLYKSNYYLPAFQYYGEVFTQGESHPYFLKATAGLLKVAEKIDDDTLVPSMINKGYSQQFAGLKRNQLHAINYMIGLISQRRGQTEDAKQFLSAVAAESPYYLKARYLLGIMAVKAGASSESNTPFAEAIKYFGEIEKALVDSAEDSEKKLYRLALLGQARAYYSQGDYAKSVDFYERVPRFSDDWYDAMYESGWAYFQNADFGKALGMVHSIQSPYFDGRYRAESFVLKATTYFQNCHFDRARNALDAFFKLYEPMGESLKPYLEGDRTDAELLELIVSGEEKFPEEIRLQILGNRRFKKFLDQVREVDDELKRATEEFPEGKFKAQLLGLLEAQRADRVSLTSQLIRGQLNVFSVFLDNFLTQARIIKFETADAERKMLEAGKDITKGPRARGPRPEVPSSRFQYWAFLGEYWIDELGFYEHSIKDECIEAVFQ